ncbi:GGDEF domain-containing protein [Sulfidibacter corallicola]|uniref:diguanylate cyclase n=1 Tax=Sulfidibacter corallicola TaxID=2818388 RepID=A0A8A4U1R8_SULCO|nr:GGDEF domain-containing protein [Sulfidibacter corallicola]QTD52675.1 GGDEF domain-containing protein [Sulfidibacter corallicola]
MKFNDNIFNSELATQRRAEAVIANPPDTFDTLLKEYIALTGQYAKLLKQAIKLTSVGDGAQRKLMRIRNDLQERNIRIQAQKAKLEQLNQKLENASVTDPLTGLHNRRYFLSFIEGEFKTILTTPAPEIDFGPSLLFLLIDIDHFKVINDTWGHASGDKVLVQFCDLIRNASRKIDTLVRWGGEEFLMVCREADRGYGATLAERLRQGVADHRFDIGTDEPITCTCSIGFAYFPFIASFPTHMGWSQVLDLADQALYAAKNSGRNAWVGVNTVEPDHTRQNPPPSFHGLRELVASDWVALSSSLGDLNDVRL